MTELRTISILLVLAYLLPGIYVIIDETIKYLKGK